MSWFSSQFFPHKFTSLFISCIDFCLVCVYSNYCQACAHIKLIRVTKRSFVFLKKLKREIKKSKEYHYSILVLKKMGKSLIPINHNEIFKRRNGNTNTYVCI